MLIGQSVVFHWVPLSQLITSSYLKVSLINALVAYYGLILPTYLQYTYYQPITYYLPTYYLLTYLLPTSV